MSIRAVAWAKRVRTDNSGQKLVLMLLADAHHGKNDVCDPSVTGIAEEAIMTERSVRRILASLEGMDVLARVYRDGRRTLYQLNWTSDRHVPEPIQTPDTGVRGDNLSGVGTDGVGADTGVRGTPDTGVRADNLSGRTQASATPDTGVRNPGHTCPTNGKNGLEREETRAGAQPPSPSADENPNTEPNSLSAWQIGEQVVDAFNSAFAGTLAVQCKGLSTSMRMNLGCRVAEMRRDPRAPDPDPAFWARLFEHLAQSAYLTGRKTQSNGQPFRLRLDWLLREDELLKARQHTYCDPGQCRHVAPMGGTR